VDKPQLLLKVIACEIAFRELAFCAARSRNLVEFEFLTQGYHDTPSQGRAELQRRIDSFPQGKYDAILLGYGLCSNILSGLTTAHTKLVVPRAHDCITFFLGSKERYSECFEKNPGTYYYTSGWLECAVRRGLKEILWGGPSQFGGGDPQLTSTYQEWVKKYGQDQADYLLQEMGRWSAAYTHGNLIRFDFTKPLLLEEKVRAICEQKGWDYAETEGDLGLLQRFLDGPWEAQDFLVLLPGQKLNPSFGAGIIKAD
jgi:hypothetical protein